MGGGGEEEGRGRDRKKGIRKEPHGQIHRLVHGKLKNGNDDFFFFKGLFFLSSAATS